MRKRLKSKFILLLGIFAVLLSSCNSVQKNAVIDSSNNIQSTNATTTGTQINQSNLQDDVGKLKVLAEDIISTGNVLDTAFTPDGKECYFSRDNNGVFTIMVSKLINGKWSQPKVAPFSGKFSDVDPVMSQDGSKLYFSSKRPNGVTSGEFYEIWVVDRNGDEWGEIRNLDDKVNYGGACYGTFTSDGTIYFYSHRQGGKGLADIYRCKLINGSYSEPENLGDMINTDGNEIDPFIAPDESFILFNRYNSLFISYNRNGNWIQPKEISIQGISGGGCIMIDKDKKYIYFSKAGNIYYTELSALGLEIPVK